MENKSGFTLVELLIVIAIIVILFITVFFNILKQVDKARDKQKKDHLSRIKIAFEDYYNDKNCYPPSTILDNCDGEELRPYLQNIPCDPKTKRGYILQIDDSNPTCPQWFKIYTTLGNINDQVISNLGCSLGCGPTNSYNYGVSSTNVNLGPAPSPSPSPSSSLSPSPSPSPECTDWSGWTQGPIGLICNAKGSANECSPISCSTDCSGIPEEVCR